MSTKGNHSRTLVRPAASRTYGQAVTQLRQSSAAGKHGSTRKSKRASGNASAIRESAQGG